MESFADPLGTSTISTNGGEGGLCGPLGGGRGGDAGNMELRARHLANALFEEGEAVILTANGGDGGYGDSYDAPGGDGGNAGLLSLMLYSHRLEERKSRSGGLFVTQSPVTALCDPQ